MRTWDKTEAWQPAGPGAERAALPLIEPASGTIGFGKPTFRAQEVAASKLAQLAGVSVPKVELGISHPHGGVVVAVSHVDTQSEDLLTWRMIRQIQESSNVILASLDQQAREVFARRLRSYSESREAMLKWCVVQAVLAGANLDPPPPAEAWVELVLTRFQHGAEEAAFLAEVGLLPALRAATCFLAFYTWIGAEDLQERNLVVREGDSGHFLSAIDFDVLGFTGLHTPMGAMLPVPHLSLLWDLCPAQELEETVLRIESLEAESISAALAGIPTEIRSSDGLHADLESLLFERRLRVRPALEHYDLL